MPVDLSKPNSIVRNRRPARRDVEDDKFDSSHARDIELKRSRGEISCAECRRLKIRCDKSIPCQSCQRRGCASLCPNGSLATGQGTRFVLAATEHLHRRVAKMSERIRQLEDALAILQAKCSNEPHPLLRDDLVTIGPEQEDEGVPIDQTARAHEFIETFGTLSMSEHGVSRFFGPTGGTEYLLFTDSDTPGSSPSLGSNSPSSARLSRTPPIGGGVTRFSAAFPFTPTGANPAVQDLIESYLPPWDRACHLSEIYLENAAWLFRGVSRNQLLVETLPTIYKHQVPADRFAANTEYNAPHELALVFLVFAVGALVDLSQEPYNAEGEHYHQLARAALCLQPVLEKPSLVTIQALHILSIYNAMSGNEVGGETSMETTWSLIALATQLSQSIGLHRDSARWGLSKCLVRRRRILFWDLFVADAWQSLTTGRPPSFSRDYIDCKFPNADDQKSENEGEPDADFESWGFRFALQCVSEVAARTLVAEVPSYATIMELDRKVREFPIPPEALALLEDLKPPVDDEEPLPLSASMQRFVLSHSREVILLYIHRSFFAQAIMEHPTNPLRSAYAPSFLAAYRASGTILKAIKDHFAAYPNLCARFWSIWTFAFSAAVVFGTVVTRGPRSPLAASAIVQLDTACELFTKAAAHSRRAAKALPILRKLSEKAHFSLAAAKTNDSSDGALWMMKTEPDEVDELDIFAGKTMLVESRKLSPSPSLQTPVEPQPPRTEGVALYSQQSVTPPILAPPIPPAVPPMQLPSLLPPTHDWVQHSSYTRGYQAQQASPSYDVSPPHIPSITPPQVPTPTYSQHAHTYSGYDWQQAEQQHQHPHQHQQQQQYPHTPHRQFQHPQPAHSSSHQRISSAPGHQYADQIVSQYRSAPMPPESYLRDRGNDVYSAPPAAYQGVQQTPFAPPAELVNLGLASRDSRLDERWASFMHESGLLDGVDFRS